MRNALQNRLDEIRARMGEQLRELGVEPHAKKQSGGYLVTFKGEGVFVPLEIMLQGSALLPEPFSIWAGSNVYMDGWEPLTVGRNGWTFYNDLAERVSFTLRGDVDKVFETLSRAISTAGLVRTASADAKVTENEDLALAYEELEKTLSLYGNIGIDCCSVEGVESLNFVDPMDRAWKFEFKRGRVSVMVDERKIATFAGPDVDGLSSLILEKFEYEASRVPKW